MLKIKALNKTYNKGKKNELTVIDNTTLEMGDKGLVALLGPSGCGKTTLLNVIGGLDDADKGDVYIGEKKITGRRASKVDAMRSLQIGYIFQNYNLVENMTVYENVAIALRMIGVRNEKEIEVKVNYVLRKTGMFRYRNRLAEMLSGGERQRVGIARAIVKDPAIIIADEPTGNLDSRNTIEIMNIIKIISRDKLVLLVTHEEDIAGFYADRIIRIRDGVVVSDEENTGEDGLDYRMDYKVYLKDIKNHKRLNTDEINLDIYNESQGKIDLDIVIRNGNILVRCNTPNTKVELVDDYSPIEFVDDHYKPIEEGDESNTSFDVEKLRNRGKRRYKSVVGPIKMIRDGYRRVRDYNALKKILLLGFAISAMLVTYSISSIFGTMNVTDDMFVTKDKSYLDVANKHISLKDYKTYEKNSNVSYVIPGDSRVTLKVDWNKYLQTSTADVSLTGSLSDIDKIDDGDIKYGRMAKGDHELVVDRMALKSVISDQNTKEIGLGKVSSFVGVTVTVENMSDFTIVGVTDNGSPCIYTNQGNFINIIAGADNEKDYADGLVDYSLVRSSVKKVKGSWPTEDYQVLVNEMNKDDMKIGKNIDKKVNGHKLKVVGYYTDKKDSDNLLVCNDTLKYKLVTSMEGVTICPTNKSKVLKELRNKDVNVEDSYVKSRTDYLAQNSAYSRASLIISIIMMAISCIEIYIIMRASFMSRVKEVGVYRAIGVKKGDIYRMFVGEILSITTLASLPGFLLMFYVLYKISNFGSFSGTYVVTPVAAASAIGIIVVANLLFGLLPVFRIIRKKPAQILSRTDIN